LLRTNFNRVADAQEYGGSMQKEYASRAATTEKLVLLKNSVNAISVTLGDTFLPAVNEAAKAVMPYLEQLGRLFVRIPSWCSRLLNSARRCWVLAFPSACYRVQSNPEHGDQPFAGQTGDCGAGGGRDADYPELG
jgi:hypothetical protein